MSKSLKNFITIDQLLQTYSANDFRMFCMLNHYSARIQLDDNGLVEAQRQWKALEAVWNSVCRLNRSRFIESKQSFRKEAVSVILIRVW